MIPARRIAVVGGGWAGLSAAVHATRAGHRVTVFETARHWGGRARTLPDGKTDNGQHILIGAYRATLELMRIVGADPDRLLQRLPLQLLRADGASLRMGAGPAGPAFALAVLRCRAWSIGERSRLLLAALGWTAGGFGCRPDRTVAEWSAALPASVRQLLIDPLCVAALNTPASQASAQIFLTVLRDGLFGGRGSSDLLLPRQPLERLLPEPAARWLAERGAALRQGVRVTGLSPMAEGWSLDGEDFDAVVLACSAAEAARLVRPCAADWADAAMSLRFEPIVTVHLHSAGARLPAPMMALVDGPADPAQFVFDHGALLGRDGQLAFVVSGADRWVDAGQDATADAVLAQARRQLAGHCNASQLTVRQVIAERRATFAATPGLRRPASRIAAGLHAAADYVEGPYPATLEGAVRSGVRAIEVLNSEWGPGVDSAMQNSVSPSAPAS